MRARALREAQVEAQRLVEATQAALAADGELLDEDERAANRRCARTSCAARRKATMRTRSNGDESARRAAPMNSLRAG